MKDFQDNWNVSYLKDFQDNWERLLHEIDATREIAPTRIARLLLECLRSLSDVALATDRRVGLSHGEHGFG